MQFWHPCWKFLRKIWKIFHPKSKKPKEKFIKRKFVFSQNVPRDTKKLLLRHSCQTFAAKSTNNLPIEICKKNYKFKFLFFCETIMKTSENLKILPQKPIPKQSFSSNCFQRHLVCRFDITAGKLWLNLRRNFAQLPRSINCFFFFSDKRLLILLFWKLRMQIWQPCLKLFARVRQVWAWRERTFAIPNFVWEKYSSLSAFFGQLDFRFDYNSGNF